VKHSYLKLGVALLLSFFAMWALSMSMIVDWDHYFWNASNAYMAAIMVMVMGLIMLGVMWSMFSSRLLNLGLGAAFLAVFGLVFYLGRQEAGVGNEAFLKSMIPHHSRAILVCQESDITDPEIEELCQGIIEAQRKEIAQMQRILDERY
jgi:hypothetical protein